MNCAFPTFIIFKEEIQNVLCGEKLNIQNSLNRFLMELCIMHTLLQTNSTFRLPHLHLCPFRFCTLRSSAALIPHRRSPSLMLFTSPLELEVWKTKINAWRCLQNISCRWRFGDLFLIFLVPLAHERQFDKMAFVLGRSHRSWNLQQMHRRDARLLALRYIFGRRST